MPKLVSNEYELAQSVRRFMKSPEYWRDVIGNHPKYFVHLNSANGPLWGLSKFCAFLDTEVLTYVTTSRHTIGGGDTQNHISRICKKKWIPLRSAPPELQTQFESWFAKATASRLKTDNIHILTLDDSLPSASVPRKKSAVSPEELRRRLKEQAETGVIGEEIAIKYEEARLRSVGATGILDIEHVSQKNSAAGFDIRSSYKKDKRYIEVKASVSRKGDVYVSLNEVLTLQRLGRNGYIYFVHITDKVAREGSVVKEVRNPFESGVETKWLRAVLFRGILPSDRQG